MVGVLARTPLSNQSKDGVRLHQRSRRQTRWSESHQSGPRFLYAIWGQPRTIRFRIRPRTRHRIFGALLSRGDCTVPKHLLTLIQCSRPTIVQIPTQVLAVMALCIFCAGVVFGWGIPISQHPYISVLRSYLDLYVVRAQCRSLDSAEVVGHNGSWHSGSFQFTTGSSCNYGRNFSFFDGSPSEGHPRSVGSRARGGLVIFLVHSVHALNRSIK